MTFATPPVPDEPKGSDRIALLLALVSMFGLVAAVFMVSR